MKFGIRIKNLDRNKLLVKVVELVNAKKCQRTTIPTRNEQEISFPFINKLGGADQ